MQVPIFPLSSALFPGGYLPLRIFEPRYLDMVSRCLREDGEFGVCLIEKGREVGQPAKPYPVGTLAKIVDWDRGDDGLLHITAQGGARFRLLETSLQSDRLLLGEIELLDEAAAAQVPVRHIGLSELLQQLLDQLRDAIDYPERNFEDAEWVGGRLGELLPVPVEMRQRWLATDDPVLRLDDIAHCLYELSRDAH
jgi:hypothetical protein